MSFWPFPKIILDELRAGLGHGVGIEIGSGAGRLRSRFAELGIGLTSLDRDGRVDLRGDARALPLRPGVAGLLVAANLLRHLAPEDRARFLDECAGVCAPRGRMLLLEDDPNPRDRAERNYRRTLELLARHDPARGGALDLGPVLASADSRFDGVLDLWLENEERVVDPSVPLQWIRARAGAADPALEELEAAVARDGMRYGRFRACVLRPRAKGRAA